MIARADPSSDRSATVAPAAAPAPRTAHRARPTIGVLTGLCAIVAVAGAVAASGLAVSIVGAVLALGLAGTTGVIWSRSLLTQATGDVHPVSPRSVSSPPDATTAAVVSSAPGGPVVDAARSGLAARTELESLERRQQQDLARRLHDGPLQHVIAALQDVTDLREGEDVDLSDLELTLREAIGGMRETATDLYDDVLRDAGLAAALGQVATSVERSGGPVVDVAVAGETSSSYDALIVSATRELLTNVRKHARASHALVVVERTRDGLLRLVVDDDGIGFDDEVRRAAAERRHLGLRSIEDRAHRVGGRLEAASTKHGSVVQVLLPMDDGARLLLARRGAAGTSWTGDGPGRLVGA